MAWTSTRMERSEPSMSAHEYSWLNSRNSVPVAKTLDEDAIERHKRKFIEAAAMLHAIQKVYGDQAKAKAMAAYGRLIDAHMLVTVVLAVAHQWGNRRGRSNGLRA